MPELKIRKMLLEAEVQQEEQPQEEQYGMSGNGPVEPTADEIIDALSNGQMTEDDLNQAVQNGEISEETYNAVLDTLQSGDPQQEEPAPVDQEVVQTLLTNLASGKITLDDLDQSLQSGEIDQATYDAVLEGSEDPNVVGDQGAEEPQEQPQAIEAKFGSVKLYEKLIELKKYISIYIESYNDIETEDLTNMQINTLAKLFKDVKTLETNLNFYMEYDFPTEDYKKNLYTYLLFNKEFAEEIKKFRNVLHLNPNKIIADRKELEEKNKKQLKRKN